MNLPNRLTLFRIVLVPVFVAFMLFRITDINMFIALLIFIVASLTDLADGRIARRNNLVTDFGKLMDPLADKLLVISALVGFVQLGFSSAWVPIIVVARELLVTSLRSVASSKGVVIAANIWGKVKTVSQMTAIIVVLLIAGFNRFGGYELPMLAGSICLWVTAAVTAISGIQYAWAYRGFIDSNKQIGVHADEA